MSNPATLLHPETIRQHAAIREAIVSRFDEGVIPTGNFAGNLQIKIGGDTPFLVKIETVTGFADGFDAGKPAAAIYVWLAGDRWHWSASKRYWTRNR